MNFKVDEFAMKFTTAFKYNIWMNMLCIDVSTALDEYNFSVDLTLRIIECMKTLVDNFLDFGQWSKSDNASTKKPYSPFAKTLDSCNLSSTQQVSIKDYKPLEGDTTRTQYWVGSGAYDDACFPGNILIWLIDYDHNKALSGAAGPQVSAEHDEADFWKKTVILQYVKPAYEQTVMGGIKLIQEFVSQFEANNEDGTYTISDIDVSDYVPLKKE
jgi:hypothetical protein